MDSKLMYNSSSETNSSPLDSVNENPRSVNESVYGFSFTSCTATLRCVNAGNRLSICDLMIAGRTKKTRMLNSTKAMPMPIAHFFILRCRRSVMNLNPTIADTRRLSQP